MGFGFPVDGGWSFAFLVFLILILLIVGFGFWWNAAGVKA
jgi:uncharacterized membrane protein